MEASPVLADPEEVMNEPAAPGAEARQHALGPVWVRPAAATVMLVAAAAAIVVLWNYLQTHGALAAASDSPPIAAVLVLAVVAVMALAVLVFRPERGTLFALGVTSAAWSVVLMIALALAWASIAQSEQQNRWHGMPVVTLAEADVYLADELPAGVDPVRSPTGVLVQSIEFLSGDNVQVSGYVWQRYGPGIPEELDRGVVLPEAVKEAYTATEVYRYEENGVETIGWYFAATLREPFEYAEFPFDQQNLWLRLWARDFSQDAVLVPDFSAYLSLDPSALPGMESEFVYTGWTPRYSGFSYSNQRYDTSFGIGDAGEFQELPELYFNLILDRNFAGPFFEHVVFAIAVAILLFGLLALTTDDESLKGRFQLSTAGVLGAASGLLFAVILKHNQLRGAVGNRGISYIEGIPIVLYGVIVVVVLNAILLAAPWKPKFVAHRNNLLPVLAYWPVLLGFLLAVTLWVFFRA
ncbi:MAG: hypothetical protein ACRDJC_06220 [Thermomicrobiales bacterium]